MAERRTFFRFSSVDTILYVDRIDFVSSWIYALSQERNTHRALHEDAFRLPESEATPFGHSAGGQSLSHKRNSVEKVLRESDMLIQTPGFKKDASPWRIRNMVDKDSVIRA